MPSFSSIFTSDASLKRDGGCVKCCVSNRSSFLSAMPWVIIGSSVSSFLPAGDNTLR